MSTVIYSLTNCIMCEKAKEHMNTVGRKYTEIKYDKKRDTDQIMELVERTNCNTFPQIFVNDEFIGGYENLLESEVRFDAEF